MMTTLLCLLLPLATPPSSGPGPQPPGHHGHGGGQGNHGNPPDMQGYIAAMEDPARDAWQKPDTLLDWLGLKPGMTVCDVGAGPGYFTLRLARRVGDGGRVYAVDVEPRMLETLAQRLEAQKLTQVTPVLGVPNNPLLPLAACDVVLVVDTYHHFPDRVAYLRTLRAALKKDGALWVVDFHARPLPVGPPPDHKLPPEQVEKEAAAAGFRIVDRKDGLPYQYVLKMVGSTPGGTP